MTLVPAPFSEAVMGSLLCASPGQRLEAEVMLVYAGTFVLFLLLAAAQAAL